ncbi:BTAD domain-containing putative transcriptional regulator [Micromonospora echinospora]|uniref:AfsR/SARP family transcriptional regulator n=1 Tax=Micromonospora echinospora TaxID=1877 RepID=UPI00340AF965
MEGVRLSVLGPLDARRDGDPVPLGGRRQRTVLAALLAARGRMMPVDRIEALVWGESRPPASRATLHGYVARLRAVLEPGRPARAKGRLLVRDGPGYALRIPPESLDAERFAALVARGGALVDRCPEEAEAALREGLALWRGPAYADVGEAAFAIPERARLDTLHATATELRMTALLALGRHRTVIGEMEAFVVEEPLRERGWELLATALYRAGRQSDALAVLRRARAHLADEQGIEPGPELRRVESAILRQDETVLAGRPVRTGNVPAPISSFVGRTAELAATTAALDAGRLVTLTGPPGVGKTRLAQEVARRRRDPDGPWFVDLSGLRDAERLPTVVAEAAGVPVVATRGLVDDIGERAVLVVDHADHLLTDVVPAVTALLARCPALRVLVTSRRSLGVPGERVVAVPPLSDVDAARLLADRVRTAGGAVPEPVLAARICRRLDALPLAIERAAVRVAALAPADVLATLDDGLLDDVIGASHRLLTDAERRLLHRLRFFPGPFTLTDVRRVAGAPDVTSALVGLVRASLVLVDAGAVPGRYRLLPAVRSYAGRVTVTCQSPCSGGPHAGPHETTPHRPGRGGHGHRHPRARRAAWRVGRSWVPAGRHEAHLQRPVPGGPDPAERRAADREGRVLLPPRRRHLDHRLGTRRQRGPRFGPGVLQRPAAGEGPRQPAAHRTGRELRVRHLVPGTDHGRQPPDQGGAGERAGRHRAGGGAGDLLPRVVHARSGHADRPRPHAVEGGRRAPDNRRVH